MPLANSIRHKPLFDPPQTPIRPAISPYSACGLTPVPHSTKSYGETRVSNSPTRRGRGVETTAGVVSQWALRTDGVRVERGRPLGASELPAELLDVRDFDSAASQPAQSTEVFDSAQPTEGLDQQTFAVGD